MTQPAAQAIWDWYAAGGVAAAAGWLYQRDVSRFNPGATPPLTEAKIIMVEQGGAPASRTWST
jgi:hypothetical protein